MQRSELSLEQKRDVMRFIRETANRLLAGLSPPEAPLFLDGVAYGGLFVTFRKGGRLRGCMGRLTGSGPFSRALVEVVELSLHDPRFVSIPLTAEQLAQAEIELSILTAPTPVTDVSTLVAGRHGVVISQGGRSGCFLPQVATERGWDLETFLSECCVHKAGLPAGAWRDPATRIEMFEVEVIREDRVESMYSEAGRRGSPLTKKEQAAW